MTGHPAEVEHAAAELGITVPASFLYLGIADDGRHEGYTVGNAETMRAAAAVLGRLDGKPVAQCLRELAERPPRKRNPGKSGKPQPVVFDAETGEQIRRMRP